MIKEFNKMYELIDYLDSSKHKDKMKDSVVMKVNIAGSPKIGHPRTDSKILEEVIKYLLDNKCHCAISEGANGYLDENLKSIGLGWIFNEPRIRTIDLDLEEFEKVNVNDEEHFIPKCLREYKFRIGIPVASKRPEMIFSNNAKLFVGAVPRKMYQVGEPQDWRPKVHINLHRSVANIYHAIMNYAPFELFINGGNAMSENIGEFTFEKTYLGDDAIELDDFVLNNIFKIEKPQYLQLLESEIS